MSLLVIEYAPTFVRMYKRLQKDLQEEVKEKIELFRNKNNHQSLRVHKLKNLENSYSFSVNYKVRIVFSYGSAGIASLLMVGSHDDVY